MYHVYVVNSQKNSACGADDDRQREQECVDERTRARGAVGMGAHDGVALAAIGVAVRATVCVSCDHLRALRQRVDATSVAVGRRLL